MNFSGQYYEFVAYHVDRETHLIDMDEVRALAREHRPRMIVTGATAYRRIWDFAAFRAIADEVGALLVTDMAHFAGLGRGRRPSVASAALRRRDDDHAQDAARTARRDDPEP